MTTRDYRTSRDDEPPRRLESLPSRPLAVDEAATFKRAYETHHGDDVALWIGPQPGSVTLERRGVTITSTTWTVLEFIVETSTAYQKYSYDPAPGGGAWREFARAPKDDVPGCAWDDTLDSRDYERLTTVDGVQGGVA